MAILEHHFFCTLSIFKLEKYRHFERISFSTSEHLFRNPKKPEILRDTVYKYHIYHHGNTFLSAWDLLYVDAPLRDKNI